jgi:type IV fimbrial biogenesis protein FimT
VAYPQVMSMTKMNSNSRMMGVTLIEIAIALALIGLLLTMALPGYATWIHNTQIRTAAEAILSGMKSARAEAIRRNMTVQLVLGANSDWTVSLVGTGEVVQSRSGADGSPSVALILTPADATTITFNGLGRVVANNDASPSITQVDIDSTALAAADSRDLRVTVGTGGDVRMCDPDSGIPANDPRHC